jgi:hypothetical protein
LVYEATKKHSDKGVQFVEIIDFFISKNLIDQEIVKTQFMYSANQQVAYGKHMAVIDKISKK